jgi:hypothetical protein
MQRGTRVSVWFGQIATEKVHSSAVAPRSQLAPSAHSTRDRSLPFLPYGASGPTAHSLTHS